MSSVADLQPVSAQRDPVAALVPGRIRDPQRLEEARAEVVEEVAPVAFLRMAESM
jgi:hypothetical protein